MTGLTKEDYKDLLEIMTSIEGTMYQFGKDAPKIIELRKKLEFKVNSDKIGLP